MGKDLAKNKKALFDFSIIETFEAGIVIKGELFLLNAHISHLNTTHSAFRPDERAPRKLLMHRKQIDKIFGQVTQEGLTLVVLALYLNDKNIVKARVALAKGKNLHDKRETIKRKEADKEARAAMKKYA